MTARPVEEIRRARLELLEYVKAHGPCRAPAGAHAGDLAALVSSGALVKTVRREWDKQTGHGANLFGGAGVMQRRRAYYSTPEPELLVDVLS